MTKATQSKKRKKNPGTPNASEMARHAVEMLARERAQVLFMAQAERIIQLVVACCRAYARSDIPTQFVKAVLGSLDSDCSQEEAEEAIMRELAATDLTEAKEEGTLLP